MRQVIARLRFLVAEDHEFQRSAMVRMLANLGATVVHEAVDGFAALAILRDTASPVDVVISDLEMPGMDGMEFVRHMGEMNIRVSIILASAVDSKILDSIATMSLAYGINLLGVIEKPITPAKLLPLLAIHRSEVSRPAHAAAVTYGIDEIAAALESNEFEPFFQPKIELATGRVKGAEALARWRHPDGTITAPYAFIGLLENNSLIDDLTWIMLRKAADFCRTWRATGVDATVSVNLSVKSLGELKIADRVTEIVRDCQLEPRHVVLEVTESAATTQVGKALENLVRLRMKGFGLSIDDYGTGYSSMQQLTRIAFTELKIDQSFVFNATRQSSSRVILESSLEMARKLSITSVAEGVETREDFDLLSSLRCDMAQGYFIARPMEFDLFLPWVAEWNERTPVTADPATASPGL